MITVPIARSVISFPPEPAGRQAGVHLLTVALDPKKIGLLRELAPNASLVGILSNSMNEVTPAAKELVSFSTQ